jgi:bidirectional [NiFe] hydrogenase diaphorase subunit
MVATDKRAKLLDATLRRYGFAPDALIESLHTAQQAYGYLDAETLRHVARALHLPPAKVFGVATFYNLFLLKPQGRHVCVVCTGTACHMQGAPGLLASIQKEFAIAPGQSTVDRSLSLLQARCFGSCALAPVITIDGAVFGKADPTATIARLRVLAQPVLEESA